MSRISGSLRFWLLLLVPTLALAQVRTTGQINGRVTDEEGRPVVGATVTATGSENGLEREATTDANGAYLLPVLPVGHWTVGVTAVGKQPQVYTFRLGIGQTVPIDAVLLAGEVLVEEVTVYSTLTALAEPESQMNLDYRQTVEELPIEDRTIDVVARLAPQVSEYGESQISIAGAPTWDTTVLLDGAEISDPAFGNTVGPEVYLEDSIEEVQVLTSGIGARYGRFQGGIINAITKSGSNRYEATARVELSKQSWNEKTPFDEEQSEDLNQVTQVTLGGFVLRDHLWFFGGYRQVPSFTEHHKTGYKDTPWTANFTEDRWSLKLRGAPVSNHVIDVGHLELENLKDPWFCCGVTPAHAQALTAINLDAKETTSAAYQGVLRADFFLELQATEKKAGTSYGGAPNGRDPFLDWATFNVYNNYWWDQSDVDRRDNETAAANVTYTLVTPSVGTHTFEAGYQSVTSITAHENKQSPTDYNLIGFNADFIGPPLPDGDPSFNLRNGITERWVALPLGGDQEIENRAVYVQDSVDLGKWRVALGLRWEDYRGSGPLPEFNMAFDDIVARLAVTYNVTDRWQVVGTWGEYVSRMHDGVVGRATLIGTAPSIDQAYTGPDRFGLSAEEAQAVLRDDSQWLKVTGFSSADVVSAYLADDIIAPVAEDRSLSLRYALPRSAGTVQITWIDRSYRHLFQNFVGEVCDTGIPFSGPLGCPADNVTGIPDETGAIVDFVDTVVWANDEDAILEYSGLSVAADYRPSVRWGVGGSYTLSEDVGNYHEAFGEAGDYPRSRPTEAAVPYGYEPLDVRHRVRAWGQYRLDFGRAGNLALSALYSYNTGRRWSKTALVPREEVPEYVSANSTYRHFFGGLNSEKFDSIQRLDVGVRYDVSFWKRLGPFLKVSVINVFNFDNVRDFLVPGVAVDNDGVLEWQPLGNCGLDDAPSKDCTGFGRIPDWKYYQRPREYFFTVGLRW